MAKEREKLRLSGGAHEPSAPRLAARAGERGLAGRLRRRAAGPRHGLPARARPASAHPARSRLVQTGGTITFPCVILLGGFPVFFFVLFAKKKQK